jgi:hypothetical protein
MVRYPKFAMFRQLLFDSKVFVKIPESKVVFYVKDQPHRAKIWAQKVFIQVPTSKQMFFMDEKQLKMQFLSARD